MQVGEVVGKGEKDVIKKKNSHQASPSIIVDFLITCLDGIIVLTA